MVRYRTRHRSKGTGRVRVCETGYPGKMLGLEGRKGHCIAKRRNSIS